MPTERPLSVSELPEPSTAPCSQPLPRGAAMLVTVQRLTGALGEPLEGIGVQPDVQVSLDAADLDRGHDAQVAVAVQRLRVAMAATAR